MNSGALLHKSDIYEKNHYNSSSYSPGENSPYLHRKEKEKFGNYSNFCGYLTFIKLSMLIKNTSWDEEIFNL